MFLKTIPFSILISFFLLSCKNDSVQENKSAEKVDTLKVKQDSVQEVKESPKKIEIISEKAEKKEIHEKIVEQFGEQWDFCNCVTKNDSINKAFEKNLSDKQSEKLMARWEYVENKCKEFLTNSNTTPEERLEHELKVKKCLKNAKK
jgi:PBP1b-binding outer membrane lipoprotein LpoB